MASQKQGRPIGSRAFEKKFNGKKFTKIKKQQKDLIIMGKRRNQLIER